MEKKIKINSAFPLMGDTFIHPGLSKREYFAGLAMQGYIAGADQIENLADGWQTFIAKSCVLAADALIVELDK